VSSIISSNSSSIACFSSLNDWSISVRSVDAFPSPSTSPSR